MSSEDTLDRLLAIASHNPSMAAVREAAPHDDEIVDFCVPVNRHFPPASLLERLRASLPDLLRHYPDDAAALEPHLAELIGLPARHVVLANGSTEVITALCRMARGPIVTTVPTFGRWTDLPAEWGVPAYYVHHRRSRSWRVDVDELIDSVRRHGADTLVLCNPNNPTGAWFTGDEIGRIVTTLADLATIVIDESFIDFSSLTSASGLAQSDDGNLVIVKSLGKSLGWHGIRLGYAVAGERRAAALRRQLPRWNVNGLAAQVLKELGPLGDALRASFGHVIRDREYLLERLAQVDGLTVFPSEANFVYAELAPGLCGRALRRRLLERDGLYLRECSNKVGDDECHLRIAVLPRAESDRLVQALRGHLAAMRASPEAPAV
ncbi:MAG: histidinol-phosphate transaminase [Burkholderiaceae bacterium]